MLKLVLIFYFIAGPLYEMSGPTFLKNEDVNFNDASDRVTCSSALIHLVSKHGVSINQFISFIHCPTTT